MDTAPVMALFKQIMETKERKRVNILCLIN
ncbi:hypothetical protein AREALGSMS7_01138 [Arenibacter algicola]|uniref:Uncharacterized protein n=1 Tax=Arenibacter algicola TaxID=616991 RepID=A0A221UTM0_9FLAO|nr:hypothetical protein AREALGSMS7_01138 [Arenibacter algicola]